MKKSFLFILFLPLVLLLSCTDLDDVNERLDEHEERLTALESLVSNANTTIQNLQKLVDAQGQKISVVSYEALPNGAGYLLTMSDGSEITLKNGSDGQTPSVGVKEQDGTLYWTVNGEIMRDADGNPIKAEGQDGESGQTPKIRVNTDGQWEVSLDGGKTWQAILDENGNPVNAVGSDAQVDLEITEDENFITIIYDGQTFVIPKGNGGEDKVEDPKIGDYYYSDGTWSDGGLISIDEHGLNAVWNEVKPKPVAGKTVIGIVFQTNENRIAQTEKDNGFINGYVIATKTAHIESKPTTYWSTDYDFSALKGAKLASTWYNNVNGYEETMTVRDVYKETIETWMPAFDLVLNKFPDKAPENSSGWFLPSTGQLWDVAANLCGSEVAEVMKEWQTYKYDATYYCSETVSYSLIDFFNNMMQHVPDSDKEIMVQDSDREKFCSIWTSTPYDSESANIIEFGSEGLIECMTNWYDADCVARPILAF